MTAIVFRILGFIVLVVIGACGITYLVTRDRRWLRFGWQLTKYSVILALIVLVFVVLERVILAV
jgi:uncharacterized membrane protein